MRYTVILTFLSVFFLQSDVGYNYQSSPIPTPYIDRISGEGIRLASYYTHSVCTPARASFLTGRYHVNTGLSSVLAPGSPAGLPSDIATIPMLLKGGRSGSGGYATQYSTAMSGKWHLGHAQHKMTPVGRGFDSFEGLYMFDNDPLTKQMYAEPWKSAMAIDWVREYANGTYLHYAEPIHATEAITMAAQRFMIEHAAANVARQEAAAAAAAKTKNSKSARERWMAYKELQKKDPAKPLFLYVAYTAAHSPLVSDPKHMAKCESNNEDGDYMDSKEKRRTAIYHLWRKQFCGMVVGMDEGIFNLTVTAKSTLGLNTIFIFASDNGGSPWFGGMNYPLRGAKNNPLEGGVRVPAFIVDFTPDQIYLGPSKNRDGLDLVDGINIRGEGRTYGGLVHVSDWLPTILSFAGWKSSSMSDKSGTGLDFPSKLDGFDMSEAFRSLSLVTESIVGCNSGIKNNFSSSSTCNNASGNSGGVHNKSLLLSTMMTPASEIGPRKEILLEMIHASDSIWGEHLTAYRLGQYKFINGTIRDDDYYSEALVGNDFLHKKRDVWLAYCTEWLVRGLEALFGAAKFDNLRITITHMLLHSFTTHSTETLHLYNIHTDPLEQVNLAYEPYAAAIMERMQQRLMEIKQNMPPQQKVWMQFHMTKIWGKTHVGGDCSMNQVITPADCKFTHPWIDDVSTCTEKCVSNTKALTCSHCNNNLEGLTKCKDETEHWRTTLPTTPLLLFLFITNASFTI